MRIVIFSDSLGRPHPELPDPERTEYEDTYGYKLRRRLAPAHEVEICYSGSMDSERAAANHLSRDQVAFRRPDIVILHLGINDCAPRIFKKGQRHIIFRDWFPKRVRWAILRLIHRFRRPLTQYIFRGRVHVPIHEFQRNLHKIQEVIKNYSPSCHFLALSIVPTFPSLAQRSYNFNVNVARYNEVLHEVFGEDYIDLETLLGGEPEEYLVSDGIHLTPKSHAIIAEHLFKRIKEFQEVREVEGIEIPPEVTRKELRV